MKRYIILMAVMTITIMAQAKTLVVYYSYTNNVDRIVMELSRRIDADVIRVEPREKGLDYAANNYAIGSAQVAAIRNNPDNAASYPEIDSMDVNIADYDCIIIGAPLWWSNMAAPLQTFLFQHGSEMAGKKIGLIVSSASSGISGVEGDAHRLIPDGEFLSPSLWLRSSQTSNAGTLLENWLKEIDYDNISTGIGRITADDDKIFSVYNLSGVRLLSEAKSTNRQSDGIYIINGKKTLIRK